MPRIFRVLFIFSIFILCCKHGDSDRSGTRGLKRMAWERDNPKSVSSAVKNTTSSKTVKANLDNVGRERVDLEIEVGFMPTGNLGISRLRRIDLNGPGVGVGSVDGNRAEDVGDAQSHVPDESVGIEEDLLVGENGERVFGNIYAVLQEKIEKLIEAYYYRPQGFGQYILNNIEHGLRVSYSKLYKDNIYAVFKGDMGILSRFESVIRHLIEKWSDSYDYPRSLLNTLQYLSMSIIFRIIDPNGDVLGEENLFVLKSGKDIEGLSELVHNVHVICEKWNELTNLIQDRILKASMLDGKDQITECLSPIANLFSNSDAYRHDEIHLLKNELVDLREQVKDKVYKLKLEEGNSLS
ncbi:hypothetical protein [Borrelia persica]|uniref:hypothetical protein n=1 Tax=Borrelia persica TaxID=44448 RepID=UPI000467531C|nr:hypothetical protein [Borrelia persica]